MSKIPTFDPLTSEAQSPLIAGLTEGLNKISGLLDLKTGTLEDLTLVEVYIDDEHRYKLYQAPLGQKLWLSTPSPVIKKNGAIINPTADNFKIDYVGGSITFNAGAELTASDTVTVSATYIVEDSETLYAIQSAISDINSIVSRYKGYYASADALETAYPISSPGDFAIIGGTVNGIFIWNGTTNKWVNTYQITDLSDYYNKDNVDNLLNTKEPTVQAHGLTADSDNYYYDGRKTWQKLDGKVLNMLLVGLSTESGGEITSADSILSAFGKIKNQIGSYVHPIRDNGEPTTSTVGVLGQEYINTSNGDVFRCIDILGDTYTWVSDMAYDVNGSAIQNGTVTRDKLSNDALYSPIVNVTGDVNYCEAWPGKTVFAMSNSATVLFTQAQCASFPINGEIAFVTNAMTSFTLDFTGTGFYLCHPDSGAKANAKIIISPPYNMIALKKIFQGGFLVSGNCEVTVT